MFGRTSPFHLAVRRTACSGSHSSRQSCAIAMPKACLSLPVSFRGVSTAAAAPALTSLSRPLEQIFRVSEAQAAAASSASKVILHTGYNAPPSTDSPGTTSSSSSSSTSYEVTDLKAFEQLLHDALHITPVTAPPSLQTPTTASSETQGNTSSSTVSTTLLANHTVRELQVLLTDAEEALAKPATRKAEIDRYVYKGYLPLLKYGTFALLSVQFIVYFNWIFFVFDWNLVEPTTYFLGYTSIFCSLVYHYYRCGEDDFTWKNLFQHLAHHEAKKMYMEKKVDAEAVVRLERRIAEIKSELARAAA